MGAGSIIVDLLMRTGSFVTDTERARKQLQKLKRDAIETGKNLAFSFVGVGAGVAGVLAALDNVADGIARYQDLADQVGDSASAISGLKLAADQSGTAMETIASASVKLTAALSKIDDESKGVGAALKAINLPVEEFKRLSPVAQLEAVARALSEVDDGATKTALAVALFGRSGAELIPFLNDLADAGGRQVNLTDEQIAAADRFSKQLATLRSELATLGQVVAADVFPVMQILLDQVSDGTGKIGGFGDISRFVRTELVGLVGVLAQVATGAQMVGMTLGAYFAVLKAGFTTGYSEFKVQIAAIGASLREDLARSEGTLARFQERLRQAASLGSILTGARNDSSTDPRSLTFGQPRRPPVSFNPPAAGGGGRRSAGAGERTSEAERYLESLQKQLDRTRDLSTVETVLSDIQSGRLKLSGNVTEQQLVGVAQLIDAQKNQADQLKAEADQLREFQEIQRRVKEEGVAVFEATRTPAEKLSAEIERLNRLLQAGAINWDTYARAQFDAQDAYEASLKKTDTAADKLNDTARELGLSFTSAFEDAAVEGKGLGAVLKGLGQDIERILFRKLITEPGADAIAGLLKGGGGGGGIGGVLGSLFGSFFGGAKAGGGDVLPGRAYLVGENGPEPFIPRTAGRILPNSALAGAGAGAAGPTYISVNVPAGTNRATASQIAAEVSRELRRSNARNN